MRIVTALRLLFCLLAASAAQAWGPAGHETVGALADHLIAGTPAEARVARILGTDLRTASVWADCVKGVRKKADGFEYTESARFPECRPFESPAGVAQMVDFARRNWSNCKPMSARTPCHAQYHYADVAIERDGYARNEVGTSDHDIVAAIDAAIAMLQGRRVPAPFSLASKQEALRLLVHLVGDIHQPLHVASVYLDGGGGLIDPDARGFNPDNETRGGNLLIVGRKNLHAEWDSIPTDLNAEHLGVAGVAIARDLPPSPGAVSRWPAEWATDTLQAGKAAFQNVSFSADDGDEHRWRIDVPPDYNRLRTGAQRAQLIKAGARLAQLLEQIFPD